MALFNLRMVLGENSTAQAIKEVGEILNETAEKIDEISRRTKRK